jgi:hypothetical protein
MRSLMICTYHKKLFGYTIKEMRWSGQVAHMGQKRNSYRVVAVKPEGNGPLERHRHIWRDNTKMDLQEIESKAWIQLFG